MDLDYFETSEITSERSDNTDVVYSITQRLQRYTRSPEIKDRNQETSGQTRKVGNTSWQQKTPKFLGDLLDVADLQQVSGLFSAHLVGDLVVYIVTRQS